MIYRLGVLTNDKPANEELIHKSIDHWINLLGDELKAGFSYTCGASAYAYIGDGNNANRSLNGYFGDSRKHYWDIPGIGDNTLYREVGMCSESPFSFNKSLYDMLIQSHNNVIPIFPAVLKVWKEVSFPESSDRRGFFGHCRQRRRPDKILSVESPAGEPCAIQSNIKVDSMSTSPQVKIDKRSEYVFSVRIDKGQKITFSRENTIIHSSDI